jgi:hypothetical protein
MFTHHSRAHAEDQSILQARIELAIRYDAQDRLMGIMRRQRSGTPTRYILQLLDMGML